MKSTGVFKSGDAELSIKTCFSLSNCNYFRTPESKCMEFGGRLLYFIMNAAIKNFSFKFQGAMVPPSENTG